MSKESSRPARRASSAGSTLSSRPNLDQLRTQAKQLLASLRAGDAAAAAAFQENLPQAKKLTASQIFEAGFRLADAQSAVARRSGFASWPALSRHVHTLRALEGEWAFVTLEVNGEAVPRAMLNASRILIDGDRFRTESPEANYEGEFLIDVEAAPATIDIEFVEGPEAGECARGVFTLDGDALTICLGLVGATRPIDFRTAPGSGHALETLQRVNSARPAGVTGGRRRAAGGAAAAPVEVPSGGKAAATFEATPSPLDSLLQGTWRALELVRDGQPMPQEWLPAGKRVSAGDEVKVIFGGQVMVHARVRYDDRSSPAHVDYLYLAGGTAGQVALGIVALDGEELRVNMAPPGAARPTDWASAPGSGRTFSRWQRTRAAATT